MVKLNLRTDVVTGKTGFVEKFESRDFSNRSGFTVYTTYNTSTKEFSTPYLFLQQEFKPLYTGDSFQEALQCGIKYSSSKTPSYSLLPKNESVRVVKCEAFFVFSPECPYLDYPGVWVSSFEEGIFSIPTAVATRVSFMDINPHGTTAESLELKENFSAVPNSLANYWFELAQDSLKNRDSRAYFLAQRVLQGVM